MAEIDQTILALHAQEMHAERLLALPNVFGVATGLRQRGGEWTDEIVVQVFVTRKLRRKRLPPERRVPRALEAGDLGEVGTDVIVMDIPEAQIDPARHRPVPGGCSIGPESGVSAGTLGGWACDGTDDTIVLLSNNHVISNLDAMPAARRIVQPGRLDGGVLPGDVIGELKRHVALATLPNPSPVNPPVTAVDAAIGTIEVERTDEVIDIGPAIYELLAPSVGMNVWKRGRTTELTTNGRIRSIGGTFNVTYANQTRIGRVANAFLVESTDGNVFSDAGDSGSLIFDQAAGELAGTFPVVGLLFAGGALADGTPVTVGNDINAVFGALNLDTVCSCVLRAIIATAFASEAGLSGATRETRFLRDKHRQVRKLRYEIMEKSPAGKVIQHLLRTQAARLGPLMTEDEEAFGLAVDLVEPWARHATNHRLLEAEIDDATVERFARLAERAAARSEALAPLMKALSAAVQDFRGRTVREVLSREDLAQIVERIGR